MHGLLTIENGTSEVTEDLLEKVGLLRRDFVEAITLAALLDFVRGETSSKFGVEDCNSMLAKRCLQRKNAHFGSSFRGVCRSGWFGGVGLHEGPTSPAAIASLAGQELEHGPLCKPATDCFDGAREQVCRLLQCGAEVM